jgi:hypothetical protein
MAAPVIADAILPPKQGTLPRFPVEPWERDMAAWLLEGNAPSSLVA